MKHYRIYKLAKAGGRIIKGKDLHAANEQEAMQRADADPDCPICEVWQGTSKVGSIEEPGAHDRA